MSDNGGYVKGILRRVGVKKGNVISEQENEIYRSSWEDAGATFLEMADIWWNRSTGFEMSRGWNEDGNKVWISWVAGDTRTEIEIWLEKA